MESWKLVSLMLLLIPLPLSVKTDTSGEGMVVEHLDNQDIVRAGKDLSIRRIQNQLLKSR
jgi:hypothetical protein